MTVSFLNTLILSKCYISGNHCVWCCCVLLLQQLYLLLHCRRGWNELWSACPLCSCQNRCGSTATRESKGSGRSPWDMAPHRWLAWEEWHHGRGISQHIHLHRQKHIKGIKNEPMDKIHFKKHKAKHNSRQYKKDIWFHAAPQLQKHTIFWMVQTCTQISESVIWFDNSLMMCCSAYITCFW